MTGNPGYATSQNVRLTVRCRTDLDVEALRLVGVTNESHENPAAHQYTVSIDDVTDELMACTCPHHVHRNAFCKHMAAVENATDNGTLNAFPSEDEDDIEPDDCDCDGLGDFPCWPCVRTGQKELPNHRFSIFYPWHAN
ncbi:SWIM zinc finger family protein [Haladaptatus sp. DYF46]|uniref:SWIM zinc finger family protein n=1 Tax=Haladaptatus sp. DYF46 TaxID=2886041 RepID=UPI001E335E5F|nr:SWIM zinc finger family protein [Haladaptatus sp. DYF46]